MLPKPIQSPYAPIKPCEDLSHHQVGTLTLEYKIWNQTTEKLITLIFEILYLVLIV